MGTEDSRGEGSSVHNSYVIELISSNTVFHFPSFVVDLDKRILIKWLSTIWPHLTQFPGFNAMMALIRV